MKKATKPLLVVVAVLTLGLVGCAATTVPPSTSFISFEKKPREATSSEVGDKSGEVCKTSILMIAPLTFGESGYYKAAKKAGVDNIASVSDSWTQIGPLFLQHCTIVTGS